MPQCTGAVRTAPIPSAAGQSSREPGVYSPAQQTANAPRLRCAHGARQARHAVRLWLRLCRAEFIRGLNSQCMDALNLVGAGDSREDFPPDSKRHGSENSEIRVIQVLEWRRIGALSALQHSITPSLRVAHLLAGKDD